MKVLFFSQFYTPESIAPSFRATENAKLWKHMGHDVTVFTGYPNYPTGKVFDGYNPKMISEEEIDGVRVLRSKLIAVPNTTMMKRLENAISYFFFGWMNIHLRSKRIGEDYDVVLGTSGTVFNACLAQLYASRKHIPFVFELRDITYLQMLATGRSEKSLAVKGMKSLELNLCKKAEIVVVVTNGFKKLLAESGVPPEKIEVITNGVDVGRAEKAYDAKKRMVLSYFGTLGISQSLKDTFPYAEIIAHVVDGFEYLIIGEGAQKEELSTASDKIPWIRMLPGIPADKLEPYYNDTQLSVITLRKSDQFKCTIPSKLFQIMGRGIAVLFIGPEGETAEIIRKHHAGIVLTGTEEEDIQTLNAFFASSDWRERLQTMGGNGRKAVENHYSRAKLAEDYIRILEAATKRAQIRDIVSNPI